MYTHISFLSLDTLSYTEACANTDEIDSILLITSGLARYRANHAQFPYTSTVYIFIYIYAYAIQRPSMSCVLGYVLKLHVLFKSRVERISNLG